MHPEPIDWSKVTKAAHHDFSLLRVFVFILCSLTALSLLSLIFAIGLQRIVRKIIAKQEEVTPRASVERPGFFKNTYFVEPPLLSAAIRNA